jgi:hypothetical protein
MRRVAILLAVITLVPIPSLAQAQEMPPAYKQVLDALGKTGDFKDNVLKVNIPRNDLSITVANVKTPTPFGFGGWVALTKGTGGMDVMMGDLVLTQEEVNPVMSALLDNGLDVTALHNHFFWDSWWRSPMAKAKGFSFSILVITIRRRRFVSETILTRSGTMPAPQASSLDSATARWRRSTPPIGG